MPRLSARTVLLACMSLLGVLVLTITLQRTLSLTGQTGGSNDPCDPRFNQRGDNGSVGSAGSAASCVGSTGGMSGGGCGDGICDGLLGESCNTCAADCGMCTGASSSTPPALVCGDGICSASIGETCSTCSVDCGACAASSNASITASSVIGGGGSSSSATASDQTCPNGLFCSVNMAGDACHFNGCPAGQTPQCGPATCSVHNAAASCQGTCCSCVSASSSVASSSSRPSSSAASSSSSFRSSSSASSCPLLLPPAPPPNCNYDITNPTYGSDGCIISYPLVCRSVGSAGRSSSQRSLNNTACLDSNTTALNNGWLGTVQCPLVCSAGAVDCTVTIEHVNGNGIFEGIPLDDMAARLTLSGAIRKTYEREDPPLKTTDGNLFKPLLPQTLKTVQWNGSMTKGVRATAVHSLQQGWAPYQARLRVCAGGIAVIDTTFRGQTNTDRVACPLTLKNAQSCDQQTIRYTLAVGLKGATQARIEDAPVSSLCVQSIAAVEPASCTKTVGPPVRPSPVPGLSCNTIAIRADGSPANAAMEVVPSACDSLQNQAQVTFYNFTDKNDVPQKNGLPSGGEEWFLSEKTDTPLPACGAGGGSSASSTGGGASSSRASSAAARSSGTSSSDAVCLFRTLGLPRVGCYWVCTGEAATNLCLPCSQQCRASSSSRRSSSRSSSSRRLSSSSRRASSSPGTVGAVQCTGAECAGGGNKYCEGQGKICKLTAAYPCTVCVAPPTINDPSSSAAGGDVVVSPAPAFCGNGDLDPNEKCDDGNSVSGDGCTSTCQREAGKPPETVPDAPPVAMSLCGDQKIQAGEQCDDGNDGSGDGCSASCLGEVKGLTAGIWLAATNLHSGQEFSLQPSSQSPSNSFNNLQASAEPIVVGHAPAGKTGPASVVFMAAGAAGGWAWMRRRKAPKSPVSL